MGTVFIRQNLQVTLVQWLKLPAWKVGDQRFFLCSDIQISKKQRHLTIHRWFSWPCSPYRPLGYERVCPPLPKVADSPFHIQWDAICAFPCQGYIFVQHWNNDWPTFALQCPDFGSQSCFRLKFVKPDKSCGSTYRLLNVGIMLAHHPVRWPNKNPTLFYRVFAVSTNSLPNAGLMLANPLRRWPNINPILFVGGLVVWGLTNQHQIPPGLPRSISILLQSALRVSPRKKARETKCVSPRKQVRLT